MGKSYRGSKSRRPNSSAKSKGDEKTRKGNDKRYSKRDDRVDRYDREEPRSTANDISWYSKYPQLLAAAGSFPYPYRPGMKLPLVGPKPNGTSNASLDNKMPGILTINWIPSFGISSNSTDPASIVGKEVYGRIRAAFSGSLEADAPDYMMYIGALDSVFLYIAWLKRIYRTLTAYTPENYLFPDGMLEAYGLLSDSSWEGLRADKVRFWQGINELVLKSRKFKCPAVMDLFNRHYWLSDHIFADSPSQRAQMYVFNPLGVYKYTAIAVEGGTDLASGLTLVKIPHSATANKSLCDTLVEFGDSLIQALDAWDDSYTISGYLRRAFEGVPDFAVAELEQGETLTADYSIEVLSQIENVRCVFPDVNYGDDVFSSVDVSKWYVNQKVSDNSVVTHTQLSFTGSADSTANQSLFDAATVGINPMISLRTESPTVADTVIASRLHSHATHTISSTYVVTLTVDACATETALFMTMLYVLPTVQVYTQTVVPSVKIVNLTKASEIYSDVTSLARLNDIAMYDWHPFVFEWITNGDTTDVAVVGDIFNPTFPSLEDVKNLHKVCMFSELNSFSIQ